jgi:hypothetical protein
MTRSRPRLAVRLAAALLALAGCAGAPARARSSVSPVEGALGGRLAAAIDPVDETGSGGFAPLASPADLGPVAPAVEAWWRRFFRPEALPARGEGMRLSARPAGDALPDLVRADYEMAVLRLEVVDSATWTLVRVADPGVDVADGAAAEVIVRQVLAAGADRTWAVALPPRLAESTWYTSSPGVDPATMASWRDRLDVRVRGGRLELLCHKRGEPGPVVEEKAWFPADLRARLAAGSR